MGLRKCLGRLEKTGPYRRNPSYIRWSGALDEQHSGGESDFRRLDDEGEGTKITSVTSARFDLRIATRLSIGFLVSITYCTLILLHLAEL